MRYPRDRLRAAGEVGLVAAGMVAFALLSAAGAGSGWAAGAGLVLAGLALYLSMRTGARPVSLFALTRPRRWAWVLVGGGAVLGAGLAVLYRWAWMPTALPRGLGAFVLVAMAIGAAEEILYRGFVQGRVGAALGVPLMGWKRVQESFSGDTVPGVPRPVLSGRALRRTTDAAGERGGYGDPPRSSAWARFVAPGAAILLAAGAHTAYKVALFAWPPAGIEIDYGFLVLWTLAGGVAFGALRSWAGSVWPALAAHVAFDLVAYGDAAEGPWWVWM